MTLEREPATTRLSVLGRIDLTGPAGPIEPVLRQPKRLGLLAYLAAGPPGAHHSRDALQALFWPEMDVDRARNALVQSIHFLRRHLGAAAIRSRGRSEVGVDPAALECDAAEFDRLLEAGALAEAVELYGGDLLPGFHVAGAGEEFERWVEDERSRRRTRAAEAAWALSRREGERGNPAGAAHWARRGLRIEPDDEEGLRRLLALLEDVGDRAGALRAYERFERRLRDELGVDPDPDTADLARRIRRGPEAAPPRAPAARGASVAVLPFLALGQAEEADWFADGLAEELTAALATSGGLKVASRTSSFAFKEAALTARTIGERLGVSSIVEGSVRWSGGRIRITVQLIDVADDAHLWAETYERPAEDLFAVQEDVAGQVARALSVALTEGERRRIHARRSGSLAAYRSYLQGRQAHARGDVADVHQAIGHFQAAVREDPQFALAHAGLAEARLYLSLLRFAPDLDRTALRRDARSSVDEALRLDPDLPEARVADAVLRWYDWDWAGSVEALERAIALAPQSAVAHRRRGLELAYLGRFDDARAALARAHELDPLSLEILADQAVPDIRERRFEAAIEWLRGVLELAPGFGPATGYLLESLVYGGRAEEFVELNEALAMITAEEAAALRARVAVEGTAAIHRTALPLLQRRGASPAILANAHRHAGNDEEAWRSFQVAIEVRDPVLTDGIRNHPGFDGFRDDPRYPEVLETMGIDPAECWSPTAPARTAPPGA